MPIVLDWRPQVDWAHEFTVEGGLNAQRQHNVPQRYHIVKRLRGVAVSD